jgi:hypothetical protein
MNLPIARSLRGLIYVVWDLSQVDPSDLAILLAGDGRMRIGFGEIDPADGNDPSDDQIREAVDRCWHNPYCAFSRPAGTSLVCIQGDWSNLADAKIKSGIAALALGSPPHTRYNPLYARAVQTPRPWGVTALFTEYTGVHEPLTVEWTVKQSLQNLALAASDTHSEQIVAADEIVTPPAVEAPVALPVAPLEAAAPVERSPGPPLTTLAEFAKALNRLDPMAVELAAGDPPPDMSIEGADVKQLLGTFWFRSIFPRLSPSWRERLLEAFTTAVVIPNHVVWRGKQAVHLADASYGELKDIAENTIVNGAVGTDLHLMLAIARLWGEDAWRRLQFVEVAATEGSSRLGALGSHHRPGYPA